MMKRLSSAFALLALAACGHTEMHEVLLRQPPGPTGRPVEIYMATQSPPRPFYEIAILQAIGDGGDATLEDVVQGLTHRGQQLGCDAIVRIQIDVGYARAHATGVCVKYMDAAPGAPAPLPAEPPGPPPVQKSEPAPTQDGTSL